MWNSTLRISDYAHQRLEDVPRAVLGDFRRMLREHLAFADRKQLYRWAGGDRVRESLIKRLDGVEEQLMYTEALVDRRLAEEQQVLTKQLNKLEQKITKFSRPKYQGAWLQPDEFRSVLDTPLLDTPLLDTPLRRLAAQRAQFWLRYDRVANYRDYDRYDFAADMLWWDVMTDGRVDGSFIPEVYQYRQAHPGGIAIYSVESSSPGWDVS
ncbi:MAG: hypothetical protein ACUVR8_03995 [Acidobacteriota bacterium]